MSRLRQQLSWLVCGHRAAKQRWPSATIDRRSWIGTGCHIGDGAWIKTEARLLATSIGRYSRCHADCSHTVIGAFCSLAKEVVIGAPSAPLSQIGPSPALTILGNDVWVAQRAVIAAGSVIGNGAVIAAGAVVTGTVPPYAVVAGVPARVIRYRFDSQLIASLQASQWWTWPPADLARFAEDFHAENPLNHARFAALVAHHR